MTHYVPPRAVAPGEHLYVRAEDLRPGDRVVRDDRDDLFVRRAVASAVFVYVEMIEERSASIRTQRFLPQDWIRLSEEGPVL